MVTTERKLELARAHAHRDVPASERPTLTEIRQRCLDLAIYLEQVLPPGRARSVAQTKLDEARMWALEAATESGSIHEPLGTTEHTDE